MPSTMREDFEAAFDDLDIEGEVTPQEILTDEIEEPEATTEEETPTESSEVEEESEQAHAPISDTDTSGSTETKSETEEKPEPTNHKAPIDWSPKEREEWSKIPKNFQEKILTREKEIASTMQETATARRTHEHLVGLAKSYAPVLAAENARNPMEAIEGLFQTVSKLRMGSQQDKAQAMAGLIQHYGIDINNLDDALVGAAPSQDAQQNSQMEQMLNQRMAPVNDLMQQMQQQQTNQKMQEKQATDNAVAQFSQQSEFINDVRHDMADLIDLAAKTGRELTLQQAYDRACSLHPEISKVLEERKQNEAILGNNNSMSAKRNAASSISGRRGGMTGGSSNLSMRDQIASAWTDANG